MSKTTEQVPPIANVMEQIRECWQDCTTVEDRAIAASKALTILHDAGFTRTPVIEIIEQRNDLLEACKAALEILNHPAAISDVEREARRLCKEAIAKATGERPGTSVE